MSKRLEISQYLSLLGAGPQSFSLTFIKYYIWLLLFDAFPLFPLKIHLNALIFPILPIVSIRIYLKRA